MAGLLRRDPHMCAPGAIRTHDLPLRRGTLYPAELRGPGTADFRTTTLLAAMSPLTLPTVANTSGMVSTASSSPSGPTGSPIAAVTGRLVAMKLTCPGRPTEPMLISTASPAPVASWAGVSSMPKAQAMKQAVAMYWIGLVIRNSETAIGSTRDDTSRG